MSYIGNAIPSATTLGGELDVNGNKIISSSNGNIDIEPHGTGNVLLGNFTFNADQSVGSSEDDYVLKYNHSAGTIGLESSTTTIASDSITYDMIQDTSSSDVVLGRYSSGAGTVQELSMGTLRSIMGLEYFKTIAVSGQSDIVADSGLGDTLTLVAGSNITLTTDASTDSVTIASSGGGGGGGGFTEDSNNNLVAGTDAGDALTSSSQYNICIGYEAGKQLQNSGDDYNIMIGYKCGVRMQGGDDTKPNVFIGQDIAPTWTNDWKNTIFIGDEVAKWHVSPFSSYGDSSADHSDIAIGNTHLGNYSGRNIAIGNNTMRAHYSEDSIQIGHQSNDILSQHLDRSVLIGGDIMTNDHGGNNNKAMCGNIVAIGYNAYLNGGNGSSDSDANVVCVGVQAGNNLTSGTNVTCIGYDSEASSATATNEVVLGDSNISYLRCNTQTISSLSDVRDKKDIEDIDIGLDFINDLRPVNFTWDRRDGSMPEIKSQGFIAQEVDAIQQKYDCEDHLQAVMKENPEKLEMSYGKLVPVLVKAIQELTDRVEELENGIR